MGSGVIYAAIVVAWISVLIPRWLRRHDETHDGVGVSRAMRVLSRREDGAPPERARQTRPAGVGEGGGASVMRSAPSPGISARRIGRARLAARRRRLLLTLLSASSVVAVLGVLELLPLWMALVPALLLCLYVVHLRIQARHETELAHRRYAARQRIEARMRRIDSAERVVAARRERDEERAAAQLEGERVEAEAEAYEEADRLAAQAAGWEPRTSPLPTYVTKPRAEASRTIDVSSRGYWTGMQQGLQHGLQHGPHPAPAAPSAPAAPGASAASDDTSEVVAVEAPEEDLVEHRRVVND